MTPAETERRTQMTTFTHPNNAPEGHEWQTRNGLKVRIYATDHTDKRPFAGAILTPLGWELKSWKADGRSYSNENSETDLIDKLTKSKPVVLWANVYKDFIGSTQSTKADALDVSMESRIALYRYEWPDGDLRKPPIVTVEDTNE